MNCLERLGRVSVEDGETGVGGARGMKNEGMVATEDIMAMYNVISGISEGAVARNGLISCPKAPPNGLAKLANAVAETRPRGVNHRSE